MQPPSGHPPKKHQKPLQGSGRGKPKVCPQGPVQTTGLRIQRCQGLVTQGSSPEARGVEGAHVLSPSSRCRHTRPSASVDRKLWGPIVICQHLARTEAGPSSCASQTHFSQPQAELAPWLLVGLGHLTSRIPGPRPSKGDSSPACCWNACLLQLFASVGCYGNPAGS